MQRVAFLLLLPLIFARSVKYSDSLEEEDDDDLPYFLRRASSATISSYYTIAHNTSLTPKQIQAALDTWATKQSTSIMNAYQTWTQRMGNKTAAEQAIKENITMVLNQLPATYKKLLTILDDETLTVAQRNNKTREFYMGLDWTLAKVLDHVIDTFDDSYEEKRLRFP